MHIIFSRKYTFAKQHFLKIYFISYKFKSIVLPALFSSHQLVDLFALVKVDFATHLNINKMPI